MRATHTDQGRQTRLPFRAEVLATELHSGSEVWGETKNLSKGGCFLRTSQCFPEGTLLQVVIKKQGATFMTDARVAYNLVKEGMGLAFLNVPASQLPILDKWLSPAEE